MCLGLPDSAGHMIKIIPLRLGPQLATASEQLLQAACAIHERDQIPCLADFRGGWQVFVIHAQIEAQAAQLVLAETPRQLVAQARGRPDS